jgi:hypothetical protein
LDSLFPLGPTVQSPGELYMAFGPQHRIVKLREAPGGGQFLAHVALGEDRLWRQDCAPQPFQDDPEGSSLYQALRRLIDHCPALVELEP